jgi:hypothetical protein
MNFILFSDNRKTQIQSSVTFEEGSVVLCDPGLDFCSTRLFNLMQLDSPLNTPSIWNSIFDTDKAPSFGSNRYALNYRAGYRYYLYDEEQFTYNSSFIINHISDPEGKRYAEAWVTYYPSADYSLSYISGDLLVTSDGVSLKPQVYLNVLQTVSLPAAASSHWSSFITNELNVRYSGDSMIMFGGPYILIYDYNTGTEEWEEALVYECGGTIISADIRDDLVIVCCNTNQLVYIEKSGTWSVTGTYTGDLEYYYDIIFILNDTDFCMASFTYVPVRYKISNRDTIYRYSEIESDWAALDPYMMVRRGVILDEAYWSWAGGPSYKYPTFGNLESTYVNYDDTWAGIGFNERKYYGFGATFAQYDNGALYGYTYLNMYGPSQCRTVVIPSSGTDFWAHHKFLVGFSGYAGYGVYYCHNTEEIIKLYDYVSATHKPYPNIIIPARSPNMSVVNIGDGTFKVVECIIDEYDTVTPVISLFRADTTKEITDLDDFSLPTPPANTSYKFLFSPDNITYYKWGGSSWITESDATNGNTYSEFVTGCQAGYAFPAGKYSAYVKIAFYTTDVKATPGFNWPDCLITLTTISSVNDTFLCDDSKILIEHLSDTETKFTSLMGPNVAVNALVGIVAPPYDVDYED